MTTAADDWELWSTRARLVVTNPAMLTGARELADSYLAKVDDAANRFRDDSEISRLRERSGWVTLSPTLAHLLERAIAAADLTDGDVDPTVGTAMRRIGYDRDLRLVTDDSGPLRAVIMPVPGYRSLRLDGSRLRLPAGVELDLGATAKAVAADRAAELVHGAFGCGVLVSLGGDIATAGPAPADGVWHVLVHDRDEDPPVPITLPAGAALATSSTASRTWRSGELSLHHVLDPRTGQPVPVVWSSVSVAAWTCVQANALSTASLVRGERAPEWLRAVGAPARFLRPDGRAVVVGAWPAEVAA
jgi:thiamine biosynthesis lipoprotein